MENNKKYDEVDFEGKVYRRYSKNWIDEEYTIAPLRVQNALNKKTNTKDTSIKEKADYYKMTGKASSALEMYYSLLNIKDIEGAKYLLPRITSCYRMMDNPEGAICIYKEYIERGDEFKSVALLTSVAAAYCDLKMINEAKDLVNAALILTRGVKTMQLSNVISKLERVM